MLTPEEGARTSLYAALTPPAATRSCHTHYFDSCGCKQPSATASDPAMQRRMWDFSLDAVRPHLAPIVPLATMGSLGGRKGGRDRPNGSEGVAWAHRRSCVPRGARHLHSLQSTAD